MTGPARRRQVVSNIGRINRTVKRHELAFYPNYVNPKPLRLTESMGTASFWYVGHAIWPVCGELSLSSNRQLV